MRADDAGLLVTMFPSPSAASERRSGWFVAADRRAIVATGAWKDVYRSAAAHARAADSPVRMWYIGQARVSLVLSITVLEPKSAMTAPELPESSAV